MNTRARCSVPATSANLGPGFDSFGLALELRNEFQATLAPEWSVEILGEGADYLRTDGRNQVARAMAAVFERQGVAHLRAAISCENRVPTGNGLGSSSTAIVGGLLLGRALAEGYLESEGRLVTSLTDDDIFGMAAAIEGHPDNVAPALFGGFTICWSEAGEYRHARFDPALGLAAVVVPSSGELSTKAARRMLPDTVSHADAVFNIAHAGLLSAALVSGRHDLLAQALDDRVHQPYRAAAVEDFDQVCQMLVDAGAQGVALSGAGPTVIGLVTGYDDAEACGNAQAIATELAVGLATVSGRRTPLALGISREGALTDGER